MVNPQSRSQVFNMTLPPEGPVSIPMNLDMAVSQSHDIDITEMVNNKVVSYISGAWIDNSANAHDITILVNGTYQSVIFPASKQGYIQLMVTNPPLFTISQASAGDIVKIIFVNFPVFPYIIGDGSAAGASNVTIVGPLPVPTIQTGPTISDYGIASLAGSSEVVFAAGEAASYAMLVNPSTNADPIYVNLAGGTATSGDIPILPGGNYEIAGGIANAVTVIGTAAETLIAFGGA